MIDKEESMLNVSKTDCTYCQAWASYFYKLLTLPHVAESRLAMAGIYVIKTANSTLTTKASIQDLTRQWEDCLYKKELSVHEVVTACKSWIKQPNDSDNSVELFQPVEFTADTFLSLKKEPCAHDHFSLPETLENQRVALNDHLYQATSDMLADLSVELDGVWKTLNDYLERIEVLEKTRMDLWEKSCQFQSQSPLEHHANSQFFLVEFIPLLHRIDNFTIEVYKHHTAAIDVIRTHFTTIPIRKYIKVDTESDKLVTNIHIYMNKLKKVEPIDEYLEEVHTSIFYTFVKVYTAALDPHILLIPETILYLKYLLMQGEPKEAETINATVKQSNDEKKSLLEQRKELVKQFEQGLTVGKSILVELSRSCQSESATNDFSGHETSQDLISLDTASEDDADTIKDSNLTESAVSEVSDSHAGALANQLQVSLIDLDPSVLQEISDLSSPVKVNEPCLLEQEISDLSSPVKVNEPCLLEQEKEKESDLGLFETYKEIEEKDHTQAQEEIEIQAQEIFIRDQEKEESIQTQKDHETIAQEENESIQAQDSIQFQEEEIESTQPQVEKEPIQDQEHKALSDYSENKEASFDVSLDQKVPGDDSSLQQEQEPWIRIGNRSNNRRKDRSRYDTHWGYDRRSDYKDEEFYWEKEKPDILKGIMQSYTRNKYGSTNVTPVKKPEIPPGLEANQINVNVDYRQYYEPLPEKLENIKPAHLICMVRELDRQAEELVELVIQLQEESRMLTSQYMETVRFNREREVQTLSSFERQKEEDLEKIKKYTGFLEAQLKKR